MYRELIKKEIKEYYPFYFLSSFNDDYDEKEKKIKNQNNVHSKMNQINEKH